MSSSLKKLLKMVSQLQLIVYLSLMNFNFPGNLDFLLKSLQSLADLKIIPSGFLKTLFEPKGETKPEEIDENLKVNGYTSSNFLVNMGGFLIIIILLSVGICLIIVLGCVIKKMKQNLAIKKWYYKIYFKIFWGIIMLSLTHSYMKVAVSNMISLKQSGWSKPADLAMFAGYLNGFPLFIMWYVLYHKQELITLHD